MEVVTPREVLADNLLPDNPEYSMQWAGALLAALREAGYAVVPVEPTFTMQRGLMLHDPGALLTGAQSAEAITRYRAMLAAAQGDVS